MTSTRYFDFWTTPLFLCKINSLSANLGYFFCSDVIYGSPLKKCLWWRFWEFPQYKGRSWLPAAGQMHNEMAVQTLLVHKCAPPRILSPNVNRKKEGGREEREGEERQEWGSQLKCTQKCVKCIFRRKEKHQHLLLATKAVNKRRPRRHGRNGCHCRVVPFCSGGSLTCEWDESDSCFLQQHYTCRADRKSRVRKCFGFCSADS